MSNLGLTPEREAELKAQVQAAAERLTDRAALEAIFARAEAEIAQLRKVRQVTDEQLYRPTTI